MFLADLPTEPVARPVEITLSAEQISLPASEKVGLVGASYQRELAPNWYGGWGVYGAVTGQRGGFFAWGVSGAYRHRQGPWLAEAGLFVGGGGGSPSWVGSGLMLRPHAELTYHWGELGLGLGVSHVAFPDGTVHSTQPYAVLKWQGSSFFASSGGGDVPWSDALASAAMPVEYTAIAGRYRMHSGSVRRGGVGDAADMRYAGFAYRRGGSGALLASQPYWLLSMAGAAGGSYDGYAELLTGFGLQHRLSFAPDLSLRGEGALGMAGAGGTVDTGGGVIGKLMAGATWDITRDTSVSFLAGKLTSRGRFKANEARLEFAFRGWDVVPDSQRAAQSPGPGSLLWAPWEASTGVVHQPRMQRKDGSVQALDVVALKLGRVYTDGWRVVGQAAISFTGDAGGYAAGTIGAGWLSPLIADSGWQLGAEASAGAAGGGLVQVGGGALWQAQLQARYSLSRDWALQADAGWFRTRAASLSTPTLGLSLVHSFSRLEGRP